MNYSFDARKVTQVAAKFIQKEDGIINIMKLVKLIYLLDRVSLDLRGIPVLGGSYFSMKNGPVTGEVLDLINSGDLDGYECDWDTCISSRANHNVELSSDPGDESLSESEKNMINEVYAQHGAKDRYALRDWCHKHLPEWHGNRMGRKEISVEKIWESLGKDAEEIHLFLQDEREIAALNVMLA